MRFRSSLLLAIGSLLCGVAAHAEGVVYGPDGAPTVVQHKLHTMTSKWEIGLSVGTVLNTALVNSDGLLLDVSWHPNEWLDFGGQLLGNLTSLSQLSDNVRAELCHTTTSCRTATPHRDELTNNNQLRLGAFAMGRLAPIYGKFNLASELPVHFQAYLLGGVGGAAVRRESVNLCAQPGTDVCTSYQTVDQFKPAGEFGGGFRFYLGQSWSIRTEVRAWLFGSSYKIDNDPTVPASGTEHGYLALIATVDGGVSFLF
ncbi:MAG TPA: outer membrane beta-barrel domain-containing protein [Myxococcales bacterium]|jgi:outer membrane beta-barrel protein|nr:outer membrane beta-barrel domain-containing protein [Myxococcales bacterium]